MSYRRAEQLFYATSSLVIATAIFLLLPFGFGEVNEFKTDVQEQFSKAFTQTIGDQAFIVDDLDLVWRGVNDFYIKAADEIFVLLEPGDQDEDLIRIAQEITKEFIPVIDRLAGLFDRIGDSGMVAGEKLEINQFEFFNDDFMTEKPLYNIVPISDLE
jgi:hypothetical protein